MARPVSRLVQAAGQCVVLELRQADLHLLALHVGGLQRQMLILKRAKQGHALCARMRVQDLRPFIVLLTLETRV